MGELRLRPPAGLRRYTPARVALPTVGHSLATSEVLDFQLAHAQARDAVHATFDRAAFARRLEGGLPMLGAVTALKSNAANRTSYLRQPELGRTLDAVSAARLERGHWDLAVVLADGLSSLAVERNAIPLLGKLLPLLLEARWTMAPVSVVEQGRVAIGDPIGWGLGARMSLVLIGERPGISSHDGLGAYLTWKPRPGRTDAERNCVSNIRDSGVGAEAAAGRIFAYLAAARERKMTGTALKEGWAELDGAGSELRQGGDGLG
jgi:ethanolamine ammonia-lyase small subunit